LAVFAALGCSSSQSPVAHNATPAEENLKKIGVAYRDALARLHHPPTSLAELQPFLKSQGNPDEILRSPGDGELYKIVWSVPVMRPSPEMKNHPVLAYEAKGTNGKRYVLDPMLNVRQMTDEEFAKVEPPKTPGAG
jgi:hypothetical protein